MKTWKILPLLCLVLALLAIASPAMAADTLQEGIFYYTVADGEAKITGADPTEEPLVIPDTIGGYPVTKIGINAFGEELMIANAEKALVKACQECNCSVSEFTVGPVFMSGANTRGYHRWAIEFSRQPADLESFASCLDSCLCDCNSDYAAKRSGDATMQRLQLIPLPEGSFIRWMESRSKLGGQNKVPRLHQTLQFVEELISMG